MASGRFNGDIFSDLAIAAPGDDQLGLDSVGVVYVLYGSANGLTWAGGQFFVQGVSGLLDVAEDSIGLVNRYPGGTCPRVIN